MVLRVGVVGCGAIARRTHIPALKAAGVEVVAFSSRTRSSAEAARDEAGAGRVEDDWWAVINAGDVDAVDICAPNYAHAAVAIAAAEAGKHVLVEKPMACTLAEADAMIAAALRGGVVLSVAHNMRFTAPFVAARNAVPAIGDVVGFRAAFGHSGPHDWAPDAAWFYDKARSGGGALIDLGIHIADLVRFVLADDAVEVSAMLTERDGIDVAAQVVLRMGNGAIGTFHASWIAQPGPDHQLTVFGTDATLHLDRRTAPLIWRPGSSPERVAVEELPLDLYASWARACTGDGPVPVSADDGRAALAIVDAAYRSASSGAITTP
jgi:predicted dehydrogenase